MRTICILMTVRDIQSQCNWKGLKGSSEEDETRNRMFFSGLITLRSILMTKHRHSSVQRNNEGLWNKCVAK